MIQILIKEKNLINVFRRYSNGTTPLITEGEVLTARYVYLVLLL